MTAYIVAQIEITDPERYAEYVRQVPATIAQYGGRYLARGGKSEALEGRMTGKRVAIVQFESYERAREWYECQAYAALKLLRQSASISSLMLVDGIPAGGQGGLS